MLHPVREELWINFFMFKFYFLTSLDLCSVSVENPREEVNVGLACDRWNVFIISAYQDLRQWRRHWSEKVNKEETETLLLTNTIFHYANLCNTIFYHCFHFSTSSLNSSSCLNVLISSTNHIHPFTHIYNHTAPSEETVPAAVFPLFYFYQVFPHKDIFYLFFSFLFTKKYYGSKKINFSQIVMQ